MKQESNGTEVIAAALMLAALAIIFVVGKSLINDIANLMR